MIDSDDNENAGIEGDSFEFRQSMMEDDLTNPVTLVERVYQLWWHWADFHLYVISPNIETIAPGIIIPPQILLGSDDVEFVYPIFDYGNKLSTSKSQDMYSAGMSMCKLFYTIEKMISILIERLKSGGISTEQEVQVAFAGHPLAQRKAFESIINLSYNVVVSNFDPGVWGEKYLENVKRLAERGYGYPPEAPRETYKLSRSSATPTINRK